LRYIYMRRRLDHVSHLKSTVTGTNSAFVVFLQDTAYCIDEENIYFWGSKRQM
jgi:hypothetical protein